MVEIPDDPLFRQRTAAVGYMCLLAHPADERRRGALYDALTARYWRAVHHETKRWYGQEWARDVRLRALRGSGPIGAGWRLICERRLPAAAAAEALHRGTAMSVSQALCDSVIGDVCNALGVMIMDESNRPHRVWRETRPVLPLAVALMQVLRYAKNPPVDGWNPDALIERPQWAPLAVHAARAYLPELVARPYGVPSDAVRYIEAIEKIAKI